MTRIETAEGIPREILRQGMELAFSDYVVPMRSSAEAFQRLLDGRGFSAAHSVVARDGDAVLGFWFVGLDERHHPGVAYIIATGVVPRARRHGLARALFADLIPLLLDAKRRVIRLEVIEHNSPAVALYQSLGFEPRRHLACFSSKAPIGNVRGDHLRPLTVTDALELAARFGSWAPSWQNDTGSVLRSEGRADALGWGPGSDTEGVLIGLPESGQILQVAVAPERRRRGSGSRLVAAWSSSRSSTAAVNIDASHPPTMNAHRRWFGPPDLVQLEMERRLEIDGS